MHNVYLKQALQILRQDKLISIISIAGTALAITMIMVIILVHEVKVANVAPEIRRDRMIYIEMQDMKTLNGGEVVGRDRGNLSYESIKECLLPLKTPEHVTFKTESMAVLNIEGDKRYNSYTLAGVDDSFWKIFSFAFVDGKPFTEEEFRSGIKSAVISQNVARQLFGSEKVEGRRIEINFIPYRVAGVVKNVSVLSKAAYSEVWIPYTAFPSYENESYICIILAKNRRDFNSIRKEVSDNQARYNSILENKELDMSGPYDQATAQLDINASEEAEYEIKGNRRKNIVIFTIIMLIPAINLSSFSLSKTKNRISEIGVRKAFGAKKYNLISQVLYENMISTLIGGVIGLLLSVIAVMVLKRVFLENYSTIMSSNDFTISAMSLFSPTVFMSVFAVCFILNILSASLPAYRFSRLPIVNALKS